MHIDFLLKVFQANAQQNAICWEEQYFNYQWLIDQIIHWRREISDHGMSNGSVVLLDADYSPNSIAILLSLIAENCIVVPITDPTSAQKAKFVEISQAEHIIEVSKKDQISFTDNGVKTDHHLVSTLRGMNDPGLILFTSGSTGEPKAAVHNWTGLLEKFKIRRKQLKIINFLLFDHWGGLNTLLYTLSNGGLVITLKNRTPDEVCKAVELHQVELLPVSPSFLNLLLLSKAYTRYDLSSLKIISYGAESMPESLLKRLANIFCDIELRQTYGLIETGVLRSKSRGNDSLWVKIGGEEFNTRVVDGHLQIKSNATMMGYLNAPSPFTEDGWFKTGDEVEVDGEYMKILGRKSDIIFVGAEKVYPSEVESTIQEMDNVMDVVVYGEKNPLLGNIVCTEVTLKNQENAPEFKKRLKVHCRQKLQGFKIPVKINIIEKIEYNARFKKLRRR